MTVMTRTAVLAHRAYVHGLGGGGGRAAAAGVLEIGVQDAPSGSADLALAVRTGDVRADEDSELVRVLSIRGAPHLHRRRDLPVLRAALRPRCAEDLLIWLAGHGPALLDSGVDALAVLETVVTLLRDRFPGAQATKGELSAAISPELPAAARPWCEGCGAEHVIENLFRLGTLLAGLELDRGDRRLVFRPSVRTDGPVAVSGDAAAALVRGFVRYAGPVRAGDAAGWLVAGQVSGRRVPDPPGWRELFDQLVPVEIDGATYRMAEADVAAMPSAPEPPPAVLLPPRDPYLLGNRGFLLPDRDHARQVWRAVGNPGVLLLDGEVAGVWRQRISGRTISLHVTPFGKLRKGIRSAVGAAAEMLAAVRGAGALEPHVLWEG